MKQSEDLYRNAVELIQVSPTVVASFVKEDMHVNLYYNDNQKKLYCEMWKYHDQHSVEFIITEPYRYVNHKQAIDICLLNSLGITLELQDASAENLFRFICEITGLED